jgi:hypothetical protein
MRIPAIADWLKRIVANRDWTQRILTTIYGKLAKVELPQNPDYCRLSHEYSRHAGKIKRIPTNTGCIKENSH